MRLNEVQKRFRDTMLDHPKALDDPPEDFAALFDEGGIALPERLKVYRNNIVGSLTDVMIASHPILEKLVGREFLEIMARAFVLENPPAHGCLNMYGAGFDTFIENYELARALPYLPDIARLEIAMNESYYAADDAPLKAEDLSGLAPEKINLILRHNVRLLASKYPVDKIRDFCIEDDPDKTMNVDTGGVTLMVARPNLKVKIVKLASDEYEMLTALEQGTALNKALEAVIRSHENFDFQGFLARHVKLEAFTGLKTNS